MRMPRHLLSVCLTHLGLLSAVLLGSAGCERVQQSVRRFPVRDEVTVREIVPDDGGAWVSIDWRPSNAKGFETACLLRRYRNDGSIENEVPIGAGLCRQLLPTQNGFLALIVRRVGDGLAVDLWSSDKSGVEWRNSGRLPCEAIGLSRLSDATMLIWDEVRLFKSADEGRTWAPVSITFAGEGKKSFSRRGVFEHPVGKIFLGVGYYGGPGGFKTGFGELSGAQFLASITVPGRLSDAVLRADGSLIALLHEEGRGQSLYQFADLSSTTPSRSVIHRESSVIHHSMISTETGLIILSAKNKIPVFFFSSFKKRVFLVNKTPVGDWNTGEDEALEDFQPKLLALSPNGSAWMYLSNMDRHEIVQVKSQRQK